MRAREVFDWRHIIKAYDDLWRHLSEARMSGERAQSLPKNWQAMHPGYPNPWQMFKSFPTTHLAGSDILYIAMEAADVDEIFRHSMNYFVPDLLLSKEQLLELISLVRGAGALRIQDILSAFPSDRHDLLWRCVGWMIKNGICRFERPPAPIIA